MAFRQALYEEIQDRLVILPGRCSPEADQHKEAILELFFAEVPGGLAATVQLLFSANGDWRNAKAVEFHYEAHTGARPSHDSIVAQVTSGLLAALMSRRPRLWPRHRWTGFKGALSDISLIESVHGLLQPTYQRFVDKIQRSSSDTGGDSRAGRSSTEEGGGLGAQAAAASLNTPTSRSRAQGAAAASIPEGPAADARPMSWADENSRDRAQAVSWLATDRLAHLLLMSIAAGPLDHLMYKHLQLAGKEHKEQQQYSVASKILKGREANLQHRVQVAASGALEEEFYQELHQTFGTPSTWKVLPEQSLTVSFQGFFLQGHGPHGCFSCPASRTRALCVPLQAIPSA